MTRSFDVSVAVHAYNQIEWRSRRNPIPSTGQVRAAMELLGQRWMLRVVWDLEPGPLRFLELRHRMDNCSSSV